MSGSCPAWLAGFGSNAGLGRRDLNSGFNDEDKQTVTKNRAPTTKAKRVWGNKETNQDQKRHQTQNCNKQQTGSENTSVEAP